MKSIFAALLVLPLMALATGPNNSEKDGKYLSSCHIYHPEISLSVNAEMTVKDGKYKIITRFFQQDQACEKLSTLTIEEGYFSVDTAESGTTRSLRFDVARNQPFDDDQLVSGGGPLYYRVLQQVPLDLKTESSPMEKAYDYEAYGNSPILNSIHEVTFASIGNGFRYQGLNFEIAKVKN